MPGLRPPTPYAQNRAIVRQGPYAAKQGEQDLIIIDGKPVATHELLDQFNFYLHPREFSWSYIALDADKSHYYLDGRRISESPLLPKQGQILFVGKHAAWFVPDAVDRVAIDGVLVPNVHPAIDEESVKLHASGAYAYVARDVGEDVNKGPSYWNVNGKEFGPYGVRLGLNSLLAFSADGKHVAFAVKKLTGEELIVVDGVEHLIKDGTPWEVAVSHDGDHWASVIYVSSDRRIVVHDGKRMAGEYADVSELKFSNDGAHFAFIAKQKDRMFVVLNGVPHAQYHKVEGLAFSLDGSRLAYAAQNQPEGTWCVVADGKEGPAYDRIASKTIDLSLFDGRGIAYVANFGKEYRTNQEIGAGVLVINGVERKRYDLILPRHNATLYVGTDSYRYVAVLEGAYGWIEETVEP